MNIESGCRQKCLQCVIRMARYGEKGEGKKVSGIWGALGGLCRQHLVGLVGRLIAHWSRWRYLWM